MVPSRLTSRVDALIDDLFREGSVASASLASILVAAQDSAELGYLLELSRRVWEANNELKPAFTEPVRAVPIPKETRRRENHSSAERGACNSG
jgi:hypothetical protein